MTVARIQNIEAKSAFFIDYLISSLRPLWLNNERRVMEIFSERA